MHPSADLTFHEKWLTSGFPERPQWAFYTLNKRMQYILLQVRQQSYKQSDPANKPHVGPALKSQ